MKQEAIAVEGRNSNIANKSYDLGDIGRTRTVLAFSWSTSGLSGSVSASTRPCIGRGMNKQASGNHAGQRQRRAVEPGADRDLERKSRSKVEHLLARKQKMQHGNRQRGRVIGRQQGVQMWLQGDEPAREERPRI